MIKNDKTQFKINGWLFDTLFLSAAFSKDGVWWDTLKMTNVDFVTHPEEPSHLRSYSLFAIKYYSFAPKNPKLFVIQILWFAFQFGWMPQIKNPPNPPIGELVSHWFKDIREYFTKPVACKS